MADEHVIADRRLYRTADGRLVPEGDADARWLFCVPGQRVLLTDAQRYGMTQADPPAEPPARKTAKKAARKTAKKAQ